MAAKSAGFIFEIKANFPVNPAKMKIKTDPAAIRAAPSSR